MEPYSRWTLILSRFQKRKQLPFDVEHCSPISLRNVILDAGTPDSILERIAQVFFDVEDILKDLIRCRNLSETTLAYIALTGSEEIKSFICGTRVMDVVMGDSQPNAGGGAEGEKKKLNVTQIIHKMTPSQKIKLALTGAKDARSILIRESSKIIALGVLANPRITIGEVEFFAKSTNLNEDVIRKIGTNSEWSKKYTVAAALVNNPKTPVAISMGFVNRMTDRDLGMLEKSRNIPAPVRTAARQLVIKRKLGKG